MKSPNPTNPDFLNLDSRRQEERVGQDRVANAESEIFYLYIFTVGEAVRSTCGKSHEEEKKENRFLQFPPLPPSNHLMTM